MYVWNDDGFEITTSTKILQEEEKGKQENTKMRKGATTHYIIIQRVCLSCTSSLFSSPVEKVTIGLCAV
jgi:hypothetical protein